MMPAAPFVGAVTIRPPGDPSLDGINWAGLKTLYAKEVKRFFKVQMQAGLIATFSAGALSIYLAWIGWGVWALAAQLFATTAIRAVLLWTLYRWRPARRFSLARMREMFSFGSYIFFSGLLGVFSSQLHAVLIGRYYDAAEMRSAAAVRSRIRWAQQSWRCWVGRWL